MPKSLLQYLIKLYHLKMTEREAFGRTFQCLERKVERSVCTGGSRRKERDLVKIKGCQRRRCDGALQKH